MSRKIIDGEDPHRLYTVTGGRSRAQENPFDLVTLIVSESEPTPGMQSEYVKILRQCRHPCAVVEIAADLVLPVSVVKILLCDLLDLGHITARHPRSAFEKARLPSTETLKQVLVGLRKL